MVKRYEEKEIMISLLCFIYFTPQILPPYAAQSAGAVEYNDSISAEGLDPSPPMIVLDMT